MAVLMHGNNHLLEYNYIHDVCNEVEDQGAFYFGRDPSEIGRLSFVTIILKIFRIILVPVRFTRMMVHVG